MKITVSVWPCGDQLVKHSFNFISMLRMQVCKFVGCRLEVAEEGCGQLVLVVVICLWDNCLCDQVCLREGSEQVGGLLVSGLLTRGAALTMPASRYSSA